MDDVRRAAKGGDPEEMAALMERIFASPGIVIPFGFVRFLITTGLLTVLAGLYRARVIPTWIAAALAVGPAVNGLGATVLLGSTAMYVGGAIVALIGFLPLGLRVLGWSDDEFTEPPEYAQRAPQLARAA